MSRITVVKEPKSVVSQTCFIRIGCKQQNRGTGRKAMHDFCSVAQKNSQDEEICNGNDYSRQVKGIQ